MYPYNLFLGLDMYDILLVVGFFSALMYLRYWGDVRKLSPRLQNLCVFGALTAVVGGYGSAVLFQAFYNYLETGVFELASDTGATFYGGLIGGAGLFLLFYFVGGRFFVKDGEHTTRFFEVAGIAAGSIAMAHGFGRIGCLFAGCCHGAVTDAWYGVYHAYLGVKTVPVQLFEALFLFALAGVLTWRLHHQKRGNMGLYLAVYAVWRFFVEYLRTDARGASPIPFLSPSQLTAVLLLLLGTTVWLLEEWVQKRKTLNGGSTDVA